MGLLSGMEKFGLSKFKNANVMEEVAEEVKPAKIQVEEKKEPPFNEEDVLFDKHYTCPVCDYTFTTRSVRAGKVRLLNHDTDLRPIYGKMDVLKYDVISCEKCGYSALIRYFGKLTVKQSRAIKETVGNSFSGISNKNRVFTYDDAISRYKLALLTAMVKNAKQSEKAYICLKLAWIYRGKLESLDKNDSQRDDIYKEELECISNAYDGLLSALSNEPLPIAGMDENTLKYVLADLARRLKKYEESIKLLGQVIISKTTNDRLKKMALDMKEVLKQEVEENK